VLRVQAVELVSLVELILAEAEARSQEGDAAACSLIQTRLPLLLSCCRGDEDSIGKVTEHLTGCIQQRGDRCLGPHVLLQCDRAALAWERVCCSPHLLPIHINKPACLSQRSGPALPRPAAAAVPAAA
jgi:hypothetical protein